MRVAATLGLTGRYAVQAGQARAGLEVWASETAAEVHLEDDGGSVREAERAYRRFLGAGFDAVIGPYGSDVVRRVSQLVCGEGRLLWNHGGSADDLPRPLLASVTAPASTYLCRPVEAAQARGLAEVVIVAGTGRFARAVSEGAAHRSRELGLRARVCPLDEGIPGGSLAGSAVLVVGTFEQDVEQVARLRRQEKDVGLLGCVAAGIEEFAARLGPLAEGVVGVSQWHPDDRVPEVGPSGEDFARRFAERTGGPPDYVAAQAAAAAHLALEAHRRGYGPEDVRRWRTSTLLGPFALDEDWRQMGYVPVAVQWEGGRRVKLP